jgi:hypothetical protein
MLRSEERRFPRFLSSAQIGARKRKFMRDAKMPEDKVEPKSEMIVKSVGTATRRRTPKPDPAEVRRIADEEKARAEAAAAADPRRKGWF